MEARRRAEPRRGTGLLLVLSCLAVSAGARDGPGKGTGDEADDGPGGVPAAVRQHREQRLEAVTNRCCQYPIRPLSGTDCCFGLLLSAPGLTAGSSRSCFVF